MRNRFARNKKYNFTATEIKMIFNQTESLKHVTLEDIAEVSHKGEVTRTYIFTKEVQENSPRYIKMMKRHGEITKTVTTSIKDEAKAFAEKLANRLHLEVDYVSGVSSQSGWGDYTQACILVRLGRYNNLTELEDNSSDILQEDEKIYVSVVQAAYDIEKVIHWMKPEMKCACCGNDLGHSHPRFIPTDFGQYFSDGKLRETLPNLELQCTECANIIPFEKSIGFGRNSDLDDLPTSAKKLYITNTHKRIKAIKNNDVLDMFEAVERLNLTQRKFDNRCNKLNIVKIFTKEDGIYITNEEFGLLEEYVAKENA